jgi:hypothetical protein
VSLDLLLAAMPGDLASLRMRWARAKDWGPLFDCAHRNGVGGLLYRELAESGWQPPAALQRQIQRQLTFAELAQARFTPLVQEALGALRSAGVQAVALKGPVLAERLHPDPAWRPSSDLDLLVRRGELDRALAALEAIGFRGQGERDAAYSRKHHYQLRLDRPLTPPIELHFRLHSSFGAFVEAEEFLVRAREYRTRGGAMAWVLCPEDEFLHLAVHAAGHGFQRLVWLYELKLFLRRFPDLNWPEILSRAGTHGLGTALAFALQALRERMGVVLPEPADRIRPSRTRRLLAGPFLKLHSALPEASLASKVAGFACLAMMSDRPAAAVVFWLRRRWDLRYFPEILR